MASCRIESASSDSGSDSAEIKYPDLPDGSIQIHHEPFLTPTSVTSMAENCGELNNSFLIHQVSILAGVYTFLDLPRNFATDRRDLLLKFIESNQEAIQKVVGPDLLPDEFTKLQVKKAKCVSCALRVHLNGLGPEKINEPGFMDQINEFLFADDLDVGFYEFDRIYLEVELTKIILSKDHGELVRFLESRPIGTLPKVFKLLSVFFIGFAISHQNIQSLQYLIDILGINDKELFLVIAYRSENEEVKEFCLSKISNIKY